MKPLLAALAALFLAAPSAAKVEPYAHDERAIVEVICGFARGTAVKIGENLYITAAHVAAVGNCTVDGAPVTLTAFNEASDYASFIGPSSPHSLKVSCAGFRPGKLYVARGYANVMPGLIYLPWLATELRSGPFVVAIGEGYPGMSGGAVIDRQGRVTGLVNMRWATRSLPLSETPLCA